MLKKFFITAFRNFGKQPGFVILNIFGLATGLASFMFIMLYVYHELTFDRFHKNYENIYRVKVVGRMSGGKLDQAVTAAPMSKAMVSDYPEVITSARVTRLGAWLIKYGDNRFNEDGVLFADSTFFSVLDFRLLRGDPKTALERPRSIILTEEYARKYFGDNDPMGQKMIVEADTILYTVTGVVQNVPSGSHMKFDMLASMSSYPRMANNTFWLNHNFYTYIVVKEGTDRAKLEQKFQEMVIKYVGPQLRDFVGISLEEFSKAGDTFKYELEPLKDIHLKGATQYNLEPMGSQTTVYIFIVIAVLILIVACINFVNLATAKSASRAKEVGVRKVSGAGKAGLIFQFLGESVVISAFATILAAIIVFILSPYFNRLIGDAVPTDIIFSMPGILILAGLIIVTGVSSGFYPAFVLASFDPAEVLKGTLNPGSMSKRLRGTLVVFQFTVSIIIIIGSIIVYNQLNFITRKDLGFEKENLIIIRRPDAFYKQIESFRTQVLQIPGVRAVGFSRSVPGTNFSNNAFFKDNDPDKNTYLINQGGVSFDFPEALGVKLTEGRFFSRDFGTDSAAILINETAVKSLGLKSPVVGQYILEPSGPKQNRRLKIIGVMKDFNIESLHKAIAPVCFTLMGTGGGDQYATVRLTGEHISETIRSIENVWQTFTANQPFQYDFFTDTWNNLYKSETKIAKIFVLFAVLAILIACLGLLGLVTYMTNKRTKEIGIRKTYGASVQEVLGLLSWEIMFLILLSSLIAYPAAYLGTKYWLDGFADRVNINPVLFISATLIAMIIGWLSISYQTIKAARSNPAESLRTA